MAPVVVSLDPPVSANVSTLTQVTVVFSEPVAGVDASDLVVRNVPATGLLGSRNTYTFTFPTAAYGPTLVKWASGHGIADRATPPNPFVAGATWSHVVSPNVVLLTTNADWRVFKGTNEASQPLQAWRQASFDDI